MSSSLPTSRQAQFAQEDPYSEDIQGYQDDQGGKDYCLGYEDLIAERLFRRRTFLPKQ
jgi:hypothetical protein